LPTSAQQIAAWNSGLPERFWRIVRQYGWWGAAYCEAIFRLADHAQSRAEQERDDKERNSDKVKPQPFKPLSKMKQSNSLALSGLDGSNPLGFLAALGTLLVCQRLSQEEDSPQWLKGTVKLSWGASGSAHTPVLHFPAAPPAPAHFSESLLEHLARTPDQHPGAWVIQMLENEEEDLVPQIRRRCIRRPDSERPYLDWVTALVCETVPEAASQLQTVRRDYLIGNLRSVMQRTNADHLWRSLFETWDYADALDNQSLHWEPSEDRRHAYQWHMPNGDPTRRHRGGMLGANRLGLEAWPLFPSFPAGDRVTTRGFKGNHASDTFWIWPLWNFPATTPVIESLLAMKSLHEANRVPGELRQLGIAAVFQLQRILVGKTPNFTTSVALA
jgi:CRISPR-associated endonuclease/helicase Cas3